MLTFRDSSEDMTLARWRGYVNLVTFETLTEKNKDIDVDRPQTLSELLSKSIA